MSKASLFCRPGNYQSARSKLTTCLSFKPKALVIKMGDIDLKRIYEGICAQYTAFFKMHGTASDWFIDNRPHCIQYMKITCDQFQLKENTFCVALSYIDRLLKSSGFFSEKQLDLISIACVLLASKFAENDAYEIALDDFYSLDGNELYMAKEIKQYELKCLKELDYNLNEASVYDLLSCLVASGVVYKDEVYEKNDVNDFYVYAKRLLIKIVLSVYGVLYSPEVIACGIVQLSRKQFSFEEKRMRKIKSKFHFSKQKELDDFLKDVKELLINENKQITSNESRAKEELSSVNADKRIAQHRRSYKIKTMEKVVFSNLTKDNTKKKTVCFKSCLSKEELSPHLGNENIRASSSIQKKEGVLVKKHQYSSKTITKTVKLLNTNHQPKKFLSSKCKLPLIHDRK